MRREAPRCADILLNDDDSQYAHACKSYIVEASIPIAVYKLHSKRMHFL
jgi:hypothetical protein